jgi:DNA primase catalytic subunit
MPGITNIKAQAEEEIRKQKLLEAQAALTIQKWVRGHWGRKLAVKQRAKMARYIEEEYGRFNREIKQGRDYDLKRYLQEKKRIREQTGLKSTDSMPVKARSAKHDIKPESESSDRQINQKVLSKNTKQVTQTSSSIFSLAF